MALMAGTCGTKHFAVSGRKTLTIEPESIPGHVTIAFWDQAENDAHSVMVIPRDQFDRALEAYLGVF